MQDKFFGDVAALVALLASDGRLTAAQADALYIENGKRQADAQALADVRTLDDWAAREYLAVPSPEPNNRGAGWQVWFGGIHQRGFDGATPDEARAKAAAWVREQAQKVQG